MIDNLFPYLSSLFEAFVTSMAFDFGTSLMVSAFGYSFNAGFAKNSKKNRLFSVKKTPKYAARGYTLLGLFNEGIQWLINHSVDIMLAAIVSIAIIIILKYTVTYIFYNLKNQKK